MHTYPSRPMKLPQPIRIVFFVGIEPNTNRVTPIRIIAVAKADVVIIFITYQV